MKTNTLLVLLLLIASNSLAAEFLGSNVGVWVGGETVSNGRDALQLGITLEWAHVEFDLSHGIQKVHYRVISEPEWKMDEWQSGTLGSLRIYPFNSRPFRPLFVWSHLSDITRGEPFNTKNEPTSDFFGAGITLDAKRLELDVTYGTLGRECRIIECSPGSRTNELRIAFRGYIF